MQPPGEDRAGTAERPVRGSARPAPDPSLLRPTAKLVAALAAAVLGSAALGSVLGLPAPYRGSTGGVASLAAAGPAVDSGIAAALYRGPFHPVRGEFAYGENDARFGALRYGHLHEGQDVFSKRGTPLVAIRDGVIVDRGKVNGKYSGGRGNYVAIYSPIKKQSYVYMHLLEPATVEKAERVHAGQLVGLMGCTGSCEGTHLHFEVRSGQASPAAKTKAVDPLPLLSELPQAPEELTSP